MTRGQRWLAGATLVALTVLAFAPSLTSPFTHYDDPLYVLNNLKRVAIPGWEGLKLQFSADRAWSGDFVEYFPLRDAVYWALYQQFEGVSWPYHLTSLCFHLVASLLVWLFLKQVGVPSLGAWLGALLFALHPVHIESVVWIAGLKDPMFMMFMVGGLCAYASYRDRPAPWKYALMLTGLVLGFLVKSILIAMPLLLLAMELWVGTRAAWSLIAKRLAGPFLISGMFFAQILGVGRANHVIVPPHGGSWGAHFTLVLWAQAKYLKQALLPTSYRLIYCFDPPAGLADWRLWVGLLVLASCAALVWRWRNERLKLFFVALYVAPMLPVSNLVPFPAIMADRYLYAPSLGVCALLGLLATALTPRSFSVLATACALFLTGATATRAAVWQVEENLWEEPDLDPACIVDSSFPAAQSHILRFLTTKDRKEGLLALERAMVTPGIRRVDPELVCTTIVGATREAQELGGMERAVPWAKLATTMCRNHATAWNAAMVVSLHKRLDLAAGAATKAWRLSKTPETEVLMWLTLLEYGDLRGEAEVLRLSKLADRSVCEKIAQFSSDAPQLSAKLGEAVHHCQPVLEDGDGASPPR